MMDAPESFSVKSKCPYCENGCDKCKDGFVAVTFASGRTYDLVCQKCGAVVGFYAGDDNPSRGMCDCCPNCDDPQDVQWTPSGVIIP